MKSNFQNDAQGAENTVVNSSKRGGKSNSNNRAKNSSTKLWPVLRKARVLYNSQLVQGTNVKKQCLIKCSTFAYDNENQMWNDFNFISMRLLDSKRFDTYCIANNLNSKAIAQHIIFDNGLSAINDVLKNGVESVYQTRFHEFMEPIYVLDNKKPATADSSQSIEESAT